MHEIDKESVELRVANLDCEHDAAAIERGLAGLSGLTTLKVYPKSAKVSLVYDPSATSAEALRDRLETLGFPPQKGLSMPEQPKPWRNPKVVSSLVSGLLLFVGWLIGLAGAAGILSTIIYVAAILIGGYYFGREALEELIFERQIGIELLMSIAAVVAAMMGQAAEGAMLVFLAIKALMDLAPKMALVRRDNREVEIPVEALVVEDVFIVRPGESMPTDGEVISGTSMGDPVYAGSINGEGALEVRATKAFADNTISRIIQMVEEAQERKGKSQRFIERFGSRYSPAVLLIGILIAILPPVVLGADWTTWITRAIVFIVAAAPCALVISIPITLVASLGAGARRGVLIKGGIYVEELAKVKVVAMDKTGTLTRGDPEVTDVLSNGPAPDHVLAMAASIERRSEHPLARAIVRYAEGRGVQPVESREFRALTGAGASIRIDGKTVYAGSPDLFQSQLSLSINPYRKDIQRLQGEGKTVVLVGDDKEILGLIAIRDNVRSNARQAIESLHTAGVDKVVMLTGDNERTAQAIARELGIDEIYADLKPEDKVSKVRELAARYGHVAMVGDGVNDAPALAEATVGVAMGAAGTDVALETADVALMADDLEKIAYALELAKRNQAVVNQNLGLSALVIGALVIGAVAGWLTLPIAVLGHEISEFIVIGNGLRMLRS